VGEGDRELYEVATSNRERIKTLEGEVVRLRDRQHQLAESVAVIRYLAEEVKSLGEDVRRLTAQTATIARRSVERPSAERVGQYLALLVAVAALIVAATR
jgi:hypothetical protein